MEVHGGPWGINFQATNSNELIPKLAIFKRNHLFQTIILGIHVSFQGCKALQELQDLFPPEIKRMRNTKFAGLHDSDDFPFHFVVMVLFHVNFPGVYFKILKDWPAPTIPLFVCLPNDLKALTTRPA